ncbi:MAG TPA: chloride channel protein [Gammaproteobacteria bacterium]|jgi:CIC family chloride channel protein|nr:chloride channel protein [Gammaproteobacteria bacterium]
MRAAIKKLSYLFLLAVLVGILAGVGAIFFRLMVAASHNLFFSGKFDVLYRITTHTPVNAWGAGIILVPVIGGIVVIWIIKTFANDERGLGIPKLFYAIKHQNGEINERVSLAKAVASAISIGSGASIGREGPAAQIGAMISSIISDIANVTVTERKLLITVGVAAGTAAIFRAPFAGAAFAIELFLFVYSVENIFLIIVAAFAAYFVSGSILGFGPMFSIYGANYSPLQHAYLQSLLFFVVLGIFTGLMSTFFIRGIYRTEDVFNALFKNQYLRHITGMFIIGVMIYLVSIKFDHYYIDGVGFATIQDCLDALILDPRLLLILIACKIAATCLSLGTGSSGGIFSPSLFTGAVLGNWFGLVLYSYFPGLDIHPAIFTLAGMAGMTSGMTGALATSVILNYEITETFDAVLPMLITVVISYNIRKMLCRESVYTLKLVRQGLIQH